MRFSLAFLVALTFHSAAHAGAWLQPEGKGQYITQVTYYSNDEFFDTNSQRIDQPRFSKYEIQPYLEYGLTKRVTIGATGFVQHVSQSGESNNGLADPEFFARTELWGTETKHLSIQPLVKFSSYFESEGPPRGGSRSTDFELSLLYGQNLHILDARDYLDVRAGYRLRANQLNDQYRADAALGLNLTDKWLLVPAMRATVSSHIDESTVFAENGEQDYNLLKVELGAHYRLAPDKLLGLNAFNHVYGTQIGNGMGLTLSYLQGF